MTVRLVRGIEIARIAATAGFDTLYVDVEHSSFSLDTTGPDLHGRPLRRHHPPGPRRQRRHHRPRARRRRPRRHRPPHPIRRRRGRRRPRRQIPAARRTLRRRRPPRAALPQLPRQRRPTRRSTTPPSSPSWSKLSPPSIKSKRSPPCPALTSSSSAATTSPRKWASPAQYDHPRLAEAFSRTIAAARAHGIHVGIGGLSTRPDKVAEFVKLRRPLRLHRHGPRLPHIRRHRPKPSRCRTSPHDHHPRRPPDHSGHQSPTRQLRLPYPRLRPRRQIPLRPRPRLHPRRRQHRRPPGPAQTHGHRPRRHRAPQPLWHRQ